MLTDSNDPNEILRIVEKKNEKNVKYLQQTLLILPSFVISLDCSKILLSYFAISGLDVMNKLDKLPHKKEALVDWIYKHQIVLPNSNLIGDKGVCGFRGSTTLVTEQNKSIQNHSFDVSHLTMTFSALNALLALDDDLSRVDKKSIVNSLRELQREDGSFTATNQDQENDVRFVYSAACISYILNDWSGFDREKAFQFLLNCMTYEGAFGQNPDAEAHGGSTFCAVASLFLMNKLNDLGQEKQERLIQWCINRQTTGFSGRVNKPWDTCYSFWIGATLKILNALQYTNYAENINYIFETFSPTTGGFSKWPDCNPDPLHTYMAICGLSLVEYPSFQPVNAALTISNKSYEHLKSLHEFWSK